MFGKSPPLITGRVYPLVQALIEGMAKLLQQHGKHLLGSCAGQPLAIEEDRFCFAALPGAVGGITINGCGIEKL